MGFIHFLKGCALSGAVALALVLGAPGIANAEKLVRHAPHGETTIVDSSNKTLPGGAPTVTFVRNGITFNLYFMDVINNTNYGFDGASTGAQAQARLVETFAYVADVINETGTLNVLIEQSISSTSSFLAFAGTYFSLSPGFNKPSSLLTLENGTPPWPGDEEIYMTVSFGFNWNFTTSPPTVSQVDFASTMLHEITHGLGFASLMSATGAGNGAGGPGTGNSYSTFTQYIYGSASANRVVRNPGPAYLGTVAERANNPSLLSFDGPLTVASYGSRPGIYAPSPFAGGSSFSHWDTGNVTGNPVMEHATTFGTMQRVYEPYEIAALRDIGWVNAAAPGPKFNFSSATYSVNEAGASIAINVTLDTAPGTSTYTVTYATGQVGDTATNNTDYNNATGSLSFTGAEVSKSFNITINDDPAIEGNEISTLKLSNAQGGAVLGLTDTAILTIVDDEIDTDGDGLLDSQEPGPCPSSTNADSDGDGINDYNEITNFGANSIVAYNPGVTNTDACNADTDNDGVSDLQERNFGTDPLDGFDFPALPVSNLMTLGVLLLAISLAGTRLLRKQNN